MKKDDLLKKQGKLLNRLEIVEKENNPTATKKLEEQIEKIDKELDIFMEVCGV